ncbi:MAG: hypothetical protein QOG49_88, partial [Frankiaceae bacterium]|nr:hypothetical protein [Frankiaceae bacterium]
MTQTDPRAIAADHAGTTGALVTLVSGSTFCVSGRSGDIDPRAAQGLFFHDTRILSRWHVRVGPVAPQIIAATSEEPYRALFVGHIPGPDASTALLVERRRYIGDGMREDIRVRNLAEHDVDAVVSIEVAADFADLFEVKEGRVVEERAAVATTARADGDSFHISTGSGTAERAVRIHADGAVAGAAGLTLQLRVPARGETVATVLVTPVVAGREYAASFPLGESVEESQPAVRMRAWRSASARIHTADFDLRRTLTQSLQDLGSLRIFDPAHPDSIA